MDRLHQVELRLARARKHLVEVEMLADEFRYSTTKSVTVHIKNWEDRFHILDSEFESLGEVESGELHVVIDEVVHNLRAALNYLVVALARFDSPKKSIRRSLQFPIERKINRFRKYRPRYLRGIKTEHVAMIERVQPYKGCDWTKLLAELSNKGKHTELIRLMQDTHNLYPMPEDRAEWSGVDSSMTMNVDVVVEVAFEYGFPVVDALQNLEAQVTNFIQDFRADLS